jgi:hypothetical protein
MAQVVDIDTKILECVEMGLDHFGASFKFVVYHELKNTENLEGIALIHKPVSFTEGLERMFGAGSLSIKKAIISELSARFGIAKEQEDLVSMINRIREDAKVREILTKGE